MEKIVLKAEKREAKSKVSDCRKAGFVPAVIYNHGKTDLLQLHNKDVQRIFAGGISESRLYSLDIGGKNEEAFIKDYQVDPVSQEVLHMDFFRITYGEKVKTHIPIHLEGKSAGEKEGGVLETFLHDIEIEILPKHLVPSITVDISELKIGDGIHANDLKLPESAKVLTEGNPIICHISAPTKAKADETEEAASAPGAEEKTEEGKSE